MKNPKTCFSRYWYLVVGIDETFRQWILAYGPFKSKEEADNIDEECRRKVEQYDGSHWFSYATVGFATDQGEGRFNGDL